MLARSEIHDRQDPVQNRTTAPLNPYVLVNIAIYVLFGF